MFRFSKIANSLLLENEVDFDMKKSFYIIPGKEDELIDQLEELSDKWVDPLQPSGLPPRKVPMYQVGELAGKMADSQLWARALLNHIETHGPDLSIPLILKNNRVKPNDIAIWNFYSEMNERFGDLLEYKLPQRGIERAESAKKNSVFGTLFKAVFK